MKPKLRKSWTFKSLKLMGNSLLQLMHDWILEVLKEDQNVDYRMNHEMCKTGCLSGERLWGVLLSVTYYCVALSILDYLKICYPGKENHWQLIWFIFIVLVVWCRFLVVYITTIGWMRLGTLWKFSIIVFYYYNEC